LLDFGQLAWSQDRAANHHARADRDGHDQHQKDWGKFRSHRLALLQAPAWPGNLCEGFHKVRQKKS
jgi:hypothetical protein